MAYKITDACIGCGACVAACPVDVISLSGVDTIIATIKEDSCILCGTCSAICPVNAIKE